VAEDPSGEEWLTVSAASKVLGISDRQTRRWAGRLADVDRKSDGRGGRLVRLSALLSLRESDAGHDRGPEVGRKPEASRTDADAPRTSERDELLEQLRAENRRVWAALEKANQLADQAQRLQATAESKVAMLESEKERLEAENRLLIEGTNGSKAGEMRESETPRYSPVHEETGAERRKTARPWWRFGRG
jgi:hypothetical protein